MWSVEGFLFDRYFLNAWTRQSASFVAYIREFSHSYMKFLPGNFVLFHCVRTQQSNAVHHLFWKLMYLWWIVCGFSLFRRPKIMIIYRTILSFLTLCGYQFTAHPIPLTFVVPSEIDGWWLALSSTSRCNFLTIVNMCCQVDVLVNSC